MTCPEAAELWLHMLQQSRALGFDPSNIRCADNLMNVVCASPRVADNVGALTDTSRKCEQSSPPNHLGFVPLVKNMQLDFVIVPEVFP